MEATSNSDAPVAWAVTVGDSITNAFFITIDKDEAEAEFAESTKGGYEDLYRIQPLYTAPANLAEVVPAEQVKVPEGWKLVPIQETPAMNEAYNNAPWGIGDSPPHSSHVWDAMLAAAPTPPTE
jgi:hypothetical protein